MTTAFILFPPSYLLRDAFFASSQPQLIAAYEDNRYSQVAAVPVGELAGMSAADECFDLTNNPHRQVEREEKYGRGRSVSVGDIVKVDGQVFLCQSMGWLEIIKAA